MLSSLHTQRGLLDLQCLAQVRGTLSISPSILPVEPAVHPCCMLSAGYDGRTWSGVLRPQTSCSPVRLIRTPKTKLHTSSARAAVHESPCFPESSELCQSNQISHRRMGRSRPAHRSPNFCKYRSCRLTVVSSGRVGSSW